jgi:hypothetical protein
MTEELTNGKNWLSCILNQMWTLSPIKCWYDSLIHKKTCTLFVLPPSHLTYCTPTKSKLYFDSSFHTVTSERALYEPHMLHVANLMAIFLSLGHLSKEFIQVQDSVKCFITRLFFVVRGCKPHAQPPSWGTTHCPLSVAATFHSCRSSLHPQPKDTLCCGDKGPT